MKSLELVSTRPRPEQAARYRERGWWSDHTVVDDLERWAVETPSATALVGASPRGNERVSYGELALAVERYAAGLDRLGVGAGDVVSTWLPSRWELAALLLACWRIGATASPMMPTFGPREVERMTARAGSSVFVTVDTAAGFEYGTALATMAPRLPSLRHQVVLGVPGAGQHSFSDIVDVAGPTDSTPRAVDPDRPSTVLFTSGTTGDPKAVIHTLNSQKAPLASLAEDNGLSSDSVLYTPHTLSHAAAINILVTTLSIGATVLVTEQWEPRAAAAAIAQYQVSVAIAAPVYLQPLLDVLDTPTSVETVVVGGAPPGRGLVERVYRQWGVALCGYWAMTEANGMFTRVGDPWDRAADSIGRPVPGLEVDLRPEEPGPITAENPGRLHVRGPGVCVAIAARDGTTVQRVGDVDEGWYDTGDLAVPDGHSGYALVGRAADRVGGAFMIPVGDVEDALRGHPDVDDAAIIETHLDGEPVACAVVEPAGPLTLEHLRAFLLEQGMTEWFLPRRLEMVEVLPRNSMGKVQKAVLRQRFRSR